LSDGDQVFGRMVVTCVLAIGLLKSGQRRVAASSVQCKRLDDHIARPSV